ncbi:Uu.00g022250.m01.CDS01 [Anthostomella pinea]|uniref:Uu.00g022250.m01.CDS01 n=1 Tax=Anthostomella pinea TaxID=933095 RepID=A0AAI8YR12_9PEZI|nr:Uu.00g022250.m01.CDS01 [Anthostomella pinea]
MYSSLFTASLLLVPTVLCQTPPGISPAASKNLGVRYNDLTLSANQLLPESTIPGTPTVSLDQSLTGTYMVMLVDQSIPQSSITSTGPQVQGLQPCRTTRLHWLQTSLSQTSSGTFVSNSSAIAEYGSPLPGLDDIAHTYVFWLFPQPANFTLPPWDAGRVYNPIEVYARMNFSTNVIAQEVGAPIAASLVSVPVSVSMPRAGEHNSVW